MSCYDPLESGTQLDSYRIDAAVARSGMATIYRATDTRDGRTVALKIPHPDTLLSKIADNCGGLTGK